MSDETFRRYAKLNASGYYEGIADHTQEEKGTVLYLIQDASLPEPGVDGKPYCVCLLIKSAVTGGEEEETSGTPCVIWVDNERGNWKPAGYDEENGETTGESGKGTTKDAQLDELIKDDAVYSGALVSWIRGGDGILVRDSGFDSDMGGPTRPVAELSWAGLTINDRLVRAVNLGDGLTMSLSGEVPGAFNSGPTISATNLLFGKSSMYLEGFQDLTSRRGEEFYREVETARVSATANITFGRNLYLSLATPATYYRDTETGGIFLEPFEGSEEITVSAPTLNAGVSVDGVAGQGISLSKEFGVKKVLTAQKDADGAIVYDEVGSVVVSSTTPIYDEGGNLKVFFRGIDIRPRPMEIDSETGKHVYSNDSWADISHTSSKEYDYYPFDAASSESYFRGGAYADQIQFCNQCFALKYIVSNENALFEERGEIVSDELHTTVVASIHPNILKSLNYGVDVVYVDAGDEIVHNDCNIHIDSESSLLITSVEDECHTKPCVWLDWVGVKYVNGDDDQIGVARKMRFSSAFTLSFKDDVASISVSQTTMESLKGEKGDKGDPGEKG
ncbi:MAG: hypothetical protein IJO40_05085, partial [Thermoguttaceae bacterium]|nr:hypothetical protein [Thermoguttaceae bacterium]